MQTFITFAVIGVLFSISSLMAQTTQPGWQTIPEGQLILRPFPHAPYPHPSRDHGFTNAEGQFFPKKGHYDDSTIGIFIPADYHAGNVVNYVVHFHGWANNVAHVIPEYQLASQMLQSRVNAILIVPQGPKNANDSGGGKLELDPGAFAKLMSEITDFLFAEGKVHTKTIGDITLTTHSGGYKVTAAILDHGGLADHITDVCLLDSSYGNLDWFANWCAASPNHRLVSFYTQHLANANKQLRALLDQRHVPYRILKEATLKPADFDHRGVMFMPTSLAHNEVPMGKDYFRLVIQYSDFVDGSQPGPVRSR